MQITKFVNHPKRHMRRVLLVLVVVLLLITGCTALVAQPTITSAPVPTATAAPSPQPATPTPTEAAITPPTVLPTLEPDTLVLWTTETSTTLTFVQTLAAEFSTQVGHKIDVVAKPPDSLRLNLLTAEISGEMSPDMVWSDQNTLAELVADNQLQAVTLPSATDAFLPATITSATKDSATWGVPLALQDVLLLLANRARIGAAPATTDQLIVQSRATNNPDADPPQYGIASAWLQGRWLLAWLNGYGSTATTADGTQPTLNTPQMVSALDLLLELRRAAPPDVTSYPMSQRLFATGDVALMIDGDWSLADYRAADPPLDLVVAPLPLVPATGRLAAPPVGGTYLMLQRDLAGDKLERARSFAAFLVAPETQVRFASQAGRVPALRMVLTHPSVADAPVLAAIAAQSESAIGLPPTNQFRCALQAIENQLPPLLDAEIDQQQAAEAMQRDAEACE